MAKKKGKVVQMPLSPENYIRTRARNLPIGDCYITKDWDKGGMANIFIVRNHTNGNKTVGLFLADIFCLGVKDTFYLFNIPESEFLEILDKNSEEGQEMIKADYPLLHNIIYGSIEFAEEYGFKPHKDLSLTKFILEEDDENIELMEIDFGIDGKPAIFIGKEKHPANIIAQLDKTAGKGNYYITYEEDADYSSDENDTSNEDFDDDEFDDENDDEYDDMKGKSFDEWAPEDFKDFMTGKKKTTLENTLLIIIASYKASLKKKEIKLIMKKVEEFESWKIIDDDEFRKTRFTSKAEEELWEELYEKITESPADALPHIEKAMIDYPRSFPIWNNKGFCIERMGIENQLEYAEELYRKFPGEVMAFCNLLTELRRTEKHTEAEVLISKAGGLPAIFPTRKEFSVSEYLNYIMHLTRFYTDNNNLNMAIACILSLIEYEFCGDCKIQSRLIYLSVTEKLMEYIEKKYNINPDDYKE